MEKFEFVTEKNIEVFSGFVGKAKSVLTSLIENIKISIKDYEVKIEDTTKEISDNEASREKCEHEITKMESKIDSIKEAIENVENTYKKIADAYSSTSKGETKELYSEIIDGAKANCEKDVDKNRSEIARLNSDIEAIKNNIAEFTKVIDALNKDLESYKLELFKFNKALEYMEKESEKTSEDLDEIAEKREISKKNETKSTKKTESKKSVKTKESTSNTEEKEEAIKAEPIKFETNSSSETTSSTIDESLKQIYDLTGYNPNKKEETPEEKEEPKDEKKVYTDNLEDLFAKPIETEAESTEGTSFLDTDFSNWENILNTQAEIKPSINKEDTVNELLKPYGTSIGRLKTLTSSSITYKNGSKIPFEITDEDVIKAVNTIDGMDLKNMKIVGPETTLLRKIKIMKEGNL